MTDKELGTAAGEIFAKAFTLGYETGREYVPVGGMALTAEQVEDVRAAREELRGYRNFTGYGRSHVNRLIAAVDALFPATEPAAVRDGSDLVVVQRSHTAKVVQSWMTLDLWTDLGKNDKDFDAEYERQGFGDLWATLLGEVRALVQATTLAPAEPAEDAKPCGSNSVTLGWCKLTARHEGLHTNGTYLWGTPSEPDPPAPAEPAEEHCTVPPEGWWCSRAANHDGPCAASEGVAPWVPQPLEADWLDQVDPRDPQSRTYRETAAAKFAEPAEEETKAERDSQGIIRINGGRIVALSRDPRELVQQWYDLAEPGSKWQRDYAAALDLFDREAASSPVVPAPTETGPWQRIEDVPVGVLQIKDRHGRTWLVVGGTWRFEWHDGNWYEPHTNINAQAPFVAAAEEGRA